MFSHPHRERRFPAGQWTLAAAVMAVVLVLATSLWPQWEHTVSAENLLMDAARASDSKQEAVSPTSADYLRRIDRLDQTSITTVSLIDTAGTVKESTTVQGGQTDELKELLKAQPRISAAEINGAENAGAFIGERFGLESRDTARGVLSVLLTPGLSAERQQEAYSMLASLKGTEVMATANPITPREDAVVSFSRDEEGLEFSLIPSTGQLVAVKGLIDARVETTVDAAGIVGCVSVTGIGGPKDLSLACADENYTLHNLTWSGWSSPTAMADGQAIINTCDPTCAEGKYVTLPVSVTASSQKSCGYNLKVYTQITVNYAEHDKKKSSLAQDETFEFDCG